ncbi:MAG: glycosyltransferase family 4 protein, partial [Chloroflexota bacterium]|nr:glycosyltransferase family 4 protein [Chloroflexota bacterium]
RHAWPPVFERPKEGKWVMIQPWEFGSLPKSWVGPMRDEVDEIWAYSNAVRDVYVDSGVPGEKVFVVPLGIDPHKFTPQAPPLPLRTRKSFRFLFVGGTIWRKGITLLLEAYWRAFRREDDVCLVIKAMGQDSFYRGQDAAEAIRRVQADPSAPEVLYLTDPLPDRDMPSLYTACHCLAHPYRGEGFGLPVAEAMACGLPAVVTKGGACDDFCSDDTAYWVPAVRRGIQLEEEPAGTPWVLEPDVAALQAQLRRAYESRAETAERGQRASDFVRKHFTWDNAAAAALDRLRALARGSAQASVPAAFGPGEPPRNGSHSAVTIVGSCFGLGGYDYAVRFMADALQRSEVDVGIIPAFGDDVVVRASG